MYDQQAKYEMWESTINRVARIVAQDFPEAEEEDLAQDLTVLCLTRPELAGGPDAPFGYITLRRLATQQAWQYRWQAICLNPQYNYRPSDLRSLLETAFSREEWSSARIPEDADSGRRDDWLAINSDILRVLRYLTDDQKWLLFNRYVKKNTLTATETVRLSRVIRRMCDLLNSPGNVAEAKRRMSAEKRKVISDAPEV